MLRWCSSSVVAGDFDERQREFQRARSLSVWRNTLDWFDGIKIGLSATPPSRTMAYFEKLVYRYDYERAV